MAKTKPIKYIPKEGSIEEVIFPQKYFSGCDVKIKMNGVVIAEISSIGYKIQEQHKPLYGYASRKFNDMIKGNRLVTGQFVMPITEYNRLEEVLNKIESNLSSYNNASEVANGISTEGMTEDNDTGNDEYDEVDLDNFDEEYNEEYYVSASRGTVLYSEPNSTSDTTFVPYSTSLIKTSEHGIKYNGVMYFAVSYKGSIKYVNATSIKSGVYSQGGNSIR